MFAEMTCDLISVTNAAAGAFIQRCCSLKPTASIIHNATLSAALALALRVLIGAFRSHFFKPHPHICSFDSNDVIEAVHKNECQQVQWSSSQSGWFTMLIGFITTFTFPFKVTADVTSPWLLVEQLSFLWVRIERFCFYTALHIVPVT